MKRKRSLSPYLWLGLALCALIALGAWFLPRQGGGPSPEQAATQSPIGAGFVQSRNANLVLVSAQAPLSAEYAPQNLVNLYEQKGRSFSLARSDIELTEETYRAATRMFAAAKQAGLEGFVVTSGYRDAAKQAELYGERNDGTAARAGESEHATGLAFDVAVLNSRQSFERTEHFQWLQAHCWEYGFILRYPKGKEAITGIPYEPWHYRYVGEAPAKKMRDRNLTLEEYLTDA